jgi:hypothetical protein
MQFLGVAFSFPTYVPPVTAWLMHGPFAYWLVNASRPRRIVELGTHYGYSYFCFCEAVSALGLETDCYAIDSWLGDEHAGFYGDDVYESALRENTKYSGFSTLLRKTFSEALADIPDGTVDLLHIDGRHYYEDVKEDFETWIPKLSERAIVLFHDTEVVERNFGIWRYWSEVSKGRTSLNLPYQHGLGILFWGKHPPMELEDFVQILNSPTARSLIVDQFSSVGEAFVQINNEANSFRSRISELSNTVVLLNSEVNSLDKDTALLKREISDINDIAKENQELTVLLKQEISDLNDIAKENQEITVLLKREISDLNDISEGKQEVISSLSLQLDTVEKLLHSARQKPLSQLVRLTVYRTLLMIKRVGVPLPQSTKNRLGNLLVQLNPESRDHIAIHERRS